jgi:O-antigen ligase
MEASVAFSEKFPLQKLASLFLITTLFVLPISSTAKSICLGLSVFAILLTPLYRTELLDILSNRWSIAALLLFTVAIVGCFWSPAHLADKKFVIEKYSKLLYLPVLAVGFQHVKTREWALHAFLLAVLLTCILSILKFHGYLQSFHFDSDRVFRNHIMTGFMVAFGTYLSFLLAYRHQKYLRMGYACLGLLFSYQVLFVNGGRTGYVVYLLLMGLLILQLCTLKQAVGALCLVVAVCVNSYLISPMMKGRIDGLWHQVQQYQHNEKNTDIGFRLQFHDYAHQLFSRHPIFGNGTASFTYFYEKEAPIPSWFWKLWEPHSQYWLIAAEFGLFGLTILFFFFFSLFKSSFELKQMKVIALAMLIPFLIGNLSDSLLFYSGSGYFFLLFMALCLGEKVEMNKRKRLNASLMLSSK